MNLVGRPPQLYQTLLNLLTAIHDEQVEAHAVLHETLRVLFILKAERDQRIKTLLAALTESRKLW